MSSLTYFQEARQSLQKALVERDEEIDLALTGLVTGENLLLVGPPGTAKSLLLSSLAKFLKGQTFSILLTKFTTPEEIWGPLDLTALKNRKDERVLDGYLATADLAFLDEIFKSSSAVLNTTFARTQRTDVQAGEYHARYSPPNDRRRQ